MVPVARDDFEAIKTDKLFKIIWLEASQVCSGIQKRLELYENRDCTR
jgi:hypothetical protein